MAALLGAGGPACVDGQANLTVVNGTSGTLTGLWVRKDFGSESWATNYILGKSLEPGLSYTVRGIEDRESYEVQAQDDEGFLYQSATVRLSFDDETVTLSDADLVAGDARLVVENRTGQTWTTLYVRPQSDAKWGGSRIASAVPAGGSAGVLVPVGGRYDLRVEAGRDAAWEVAGNAVAGRELTVEVTMEDALTEGRLTVVNEIDFGNGGDNSLIAVFVSELGSGAWSPDLLQATIANDAAMDFPVHPGTWEVKVVDVAGNTYQRTSDPITAGFSAEVTFLVTDQVASP
jgi:hypothetical protein